KIIERNYWKKWGEIDVVVKNRKTKKLYFIEVKTVSCDGLKEGIPDKMSNYRVDNNVHSQKLKRLSRVFQTYLVERGFSNKVEWQFDIIVVFLDLENKVSRVKSFKDIII
ncbi:MAG: YraN family protein, partial [Patescibacteria group bacterium]|nr:YraN family protein [Patescibacteria group bacterium]